MDFFIGFLLGVVVGGGIMLFVYRNNKKKMTAVADGLEREVNEWKQKFFDKDEEKKEG